MLDEELFEAVQLNSGFSIHHIYLLFLHGARRDSKTIKCQIKL